MQIELTDREAEVMFRCLDGTEFVLERVLEVSRDEIFEAKCSSQQKIREARAKEKEKK